jgi:methyl-accepting chemotaxis protein
MANLSFKVAVPIIIAGAFIISVFIAMNYQNINVNFYIVFSLVTLYIFLFGFATGQNFSMPVKKILKKATQLSEGDLSSRVYLESKDELGELSRIFNKIAEELEQSRQENEKVEKTVDIKVKARTQALEETIGALEQKVRNRTIELERTMAESERLRQEIEDGQAQISRIKESTVARPKSKKDRGAPIQENNQPKSEEKSFVL